jgi:ABC-2 type transport system ATP-binding protein
MIKATHLTKKYKETLAVDDISFEVETGKVTGFLGPNGAGKSTTMRLMLELDNGGGKTTFDGKPLREHDHPARVVGVLLEAKAFHPTRSARNHLRVLAAASGIADSRVDEALDIVGLLDVARKQPGSFSLGMSQRLGIAAAILSHPKYLLLDEPANGLDPEGISWLRHFLRDYAQAGNGVFVSSHLLSEMTLMADNVVVIGRGRLIADTSIQELTSRGGRSKVYVRTDKPAQLTALLADQKLAYEPHEEGLYVTAPTTDAVGALAFDHGIPLLELSSHRASLEDIFLELTEGEKQFKPKAEAPDAP